MTELTPIQKQLEAMMEEFLILWQMVDAKDTAEGFKTSDDEIQMRRIRAAIFSLSFDYH